MNPIVPLRRSIGLAVAAPAGFSAGKNTVGLPNLGPCPPRGNAPQHDVVTLIATSLEPGALQARPRPTAAGGRPSPGTTRSRRACSAASRTLQPSMWSLTRPIACMNA
jgi:hypothetical protein